MGDKYGYHLANIASLPTVTATATARWLCKYNLDREPVHCDVQNHLNTSSKFKRRNHIWRCGYAPNRYDGSEMLWHVESTDYTKMITLREKSGTIHKPSPKFCCWERAI